MEHIENKIISFMNSHNMLEETSKVYVATSGGADSMALLAFMNKHRKDFGIEVSAVHVNHGIRGETARRDANFVKEYCDKHGIEFVLFDAEADKIEVPENASEEWARQLRYNYFDRLSKENVKIVTAHTLSDQTETLLFRMARGGSGLNGLTGIPIKRGNFIRPFLCINREEVEKLVEYYGTSNITDETNLGDDYSRNKIRHYVVPVLKGINQNAEESIGKVCDRIAKAQRYIEKQARMELISAEEIAGLKYKLAGFIGKDDIILDEMLLQLLGNIGEQNEQFVEILKEFIYKANQEDTMEIVAGGLQVSDEYSILVTNRYITIKRTKEENVVGCGVGRNLFGLYNYGVDVNELTKKEFNTVCTSKYQLCNYADASKLDLSKCVLRGKQDGDVFKPACKMKGKLVKFMRKIPLAERDSVPVLEYNGEIIWVWGIGFTDGFTPSEETKKVYELKSI